MRWWAKQAEAAEALLTHRRVFVKASHSVGKSFLAGGLVNWFFDCFDPGICITSAPTAPQVRDILWKEIRMQRPADRRGVLQPKAPRMETSPNHFAVGYTARDGSAFQGRHEERVFIVFDECVGIPSQFWDAAEGMLTGDECYFLALCNPTDTGSRAYLECLNLDKWHVIEISALEHPNIAADLAGRRAPFPKAVRLGWVSGKLEEWCTAVPNPPAPFPDSLASRRREGGASELPCAAVAAEVHAGDFEFPAGSGRWYRPGPLFESRVLGRWPTQGRYSVWNEAMWAAALVRQRDDVGLPVVIGCDVARFGDDFTSIVVRRGACVLHHETHNGWDTAQTAGRLKELAAEWGGKREEGRGNGDPSAAAGAVAVEVYVDDDGVGGGVKDQGGEFRFFGVSGAAKAVDRGGYPNKRSELWFGTAERAARGELDLSRLSEGSLRLIQRQVMAPTWRQDGAGRRMVEAKADTKRRLGRSPDDADALNLAFAVVPRLESDPGMHRRIWGGADDEMMR